MSKNAVPLIDHETEKAEIDMLLLGLKSRYGYDFTHYSFASLKRRIEKSMGIVRIRSYVEFLDHLLENEHHFDIFLENMSVSVTTMFRDPSFYKAFREEVIPHLKTFPFIKIWHAGCATGEEVYSMAILLHEEGLLERARLYATDFNIHSLRTAEQAVYTTKNIKTYEENYYASGGQNNFSYYYSDRYERMKIKDFLRERVTFSYHNLVTDGVFGEMNVICCRNVLIYFDKILQNHVLGTFAASTRHGGFLCLGSKESLTFTAANSYFETEDRKNRIFRRNMVPHAL